MDEYLRQQMDKYQKPAGLLKLALGSLLVSVVILSDSIGQVRKGGGQQNKGVSVAGHKLFGVSLRPQAVALLKEVEKIYSKAIREEWGKGWDPGYWAESEVASDGAPVIRVNPQTGRNETNIVHELWHLKLTAQGVPKREWARLVGVSNEINQQLTHDLDGLLFDTILHWKFFPEMRKMGYNPNAQDRIESEKMLRISLQDGSHKIASHPILVPLTYFSVYLQTADGNLVSRLERWYRKNKLDKELEVGKQLAKIVKESKTDTPFEQIDVYIRCLNLLLKGKARFQVHEWKKEMLGSFERRIATIYILPPI